MRRTAVLLIVVVLALFAGCINQQEEATPTPVVTPEPTVEPTGPGNYTDVTDLGGVADEESLGFGLEEEPVF